MISSIDKALVALIMSVLYILQNVFQVEVGPINQNQIELLIAFITPFLVYLIPNKKKEG